VKLLLDEYGIGTHKYEMDDMKNDANTMIYGKNYKQANSSTRELNNITSMQ